MKYLTILFVVFLIPIIAFAGGIVIPGGVGNAVNKGAGGTSGFEGGFIFLNPAELGFKNNPGFQLSCESIYTDFSFENIHSKEAFYLPTFAAYYGSDNFGFGIGANSPYGLGTRWLGTPEMESFIGLSRIYFGTGIGNDNLSFGASLNLDYGEARMKSPLIMYNMLLGSTDTNMDGFGVSFSVGALWKPIEWLQLGGSWTSNSHIQLTGDTELNSPLLPDDDDDLAVTLNYPSKLNLATVIGPEKFHLAFDVNYYDFSVKNVEFRYDDWANQDNRLDWRDVWVFHSGIEWRCWQNFSEDSSIKIRAGWAYLPDVIPAHTRSPLMYDTSGHSFSGGLGWNWKNFSVDAAYIYAGGNDQDSPNYSAKLHEVLLGINYLF